MGTGASSTPSPYRVGVPTIGTYSRSEYDKELWDDLANVVYENRETGGAGFVATVGTSYFVCAIDVPCPVKCRLEMHGLARGGGGADWDGFIQIDGVDRAHSGATVQSSGNSGGHAWFGSGDVEPGTHTVRLRLSIFTGGDDNSFYSTSLMVRRGRIPPS